MNDQPLDGWLADIPSDRFVGPRTSKCPDCGGKLQPIMYGMPSYETFAEWEKRGLAVGGCVVERFTHQCAVCEGRFVRTTGTMA